MHPNFLAVFNNALEAYKERTGTNLIDHSLTARIMSCQTPKDTLDVLQEQLHELGHSRHERLHLVVDALHRFSAPLGEGVGMVCLFKLTCIIACLGLSFVSSHLILRYMVGIPACEGYLCRSWSSSPGTIHIS